MYIVTYKNEYGDEITLCNEAPYFFLSQTGFDGIDAQAILAKAPYQKGKTRLGANIDERVIGIKACLVTEDLEEFELRRKFILKTFSPLCTGSLHIKDVTTERMFSNVQIISAPEFNDKDYTLPDGIVYFSFTMIVPSNFAEDVKQTDLKLVQVTPMFSFPLIFEQKIEFGTVSSGSAAFINDGDVETPVKITIPGFVRTPAIINLVTGEFIKVHTPIAGNEVMTILTGFGQKSVTITDDKSYTRNAFHYIDVNSTFFTLKVGVNKLKFEAEEGNDTANITVSYKRLFLGI